MRRTLVLVSVAYFLLFFLSVIGGPEYTLQNLDDMMLIGGKINAMWVVAPASLLLLPLSVIYLRWKSSWAVLIRDLWVVVFLFGTAYTGFLAWVLSA